MIRSEALGPKGTAAIWAATVVLALVLDGNALIIAAVVLLPVSYLSDGPFGRMKRWIFTLLSLMLFSALLLAPPDRTIWGVHVSLAGFRLGLQMGARALILLTGVRFLTNHLSPIAVVTVIEHQYPGIGVATGMAFNILSELTRRVKEIAICFNQRRRRRLGLDELQKFLLALFTDVLNAADEMAIAAELRGLERYMPQASVARGKYDVQAYGVLAASFALAVAVRVWM